MASGYGAYGGAGRCHGLFVDFQKCSRTSEDYRECGLLKEDYFECLHKNKQRARNKLVVEQLRKQGMPTEEQLEEFRKEQLAGKKSVAKTSH